MTQHQTAMLERHILDRAHRALDRLLAHIETTAEVAGTLEASALSGVVQSLLDDIDKTLLPHMEWEEQVCFPDTDRLAGTPWATRLLRLQHEQIRQHLEQLRVAGLGQIEPHQRAILELRAHLYELHGLLNCHLEQEEHALLTLLVAAPDEAHAATG